MDQSDAGVARANVAKRSVAQSGERAATGRHTGTSTAATHAYVYLSFSVHYAVIAGAVKLKSVAEMEMFVCLCLHWNL